MSNGNIVLLSSLLVIGYLIMAYNRFVSLRAGIDDFWSDMDMLLKRRYDLIPELVDTLKGYKEFKSKTLENVIKARQQGLSAVTMKEKSAAANMLSSSLGKLFTLAEDYPDLKANTDFLKLQDELSNLEDSIQSTRRYYNAIVRDYNYRLESFPDKVMAKILKYTSRKYFKLEVYEATDN